MKKSASKSTSVNKRRERDYSDLNLRSLIPVRPRDLPRVPEFAKHLDHIYLIPAKPKRQLTIRLDADVIDWLRGLGKGYQTKLNALLREAMMASRPR